jgi:hypothetical protein
VLLLIRRLFARKWLRRTVGLTVLGGGGYVLLAGMQYVLTDYYFCNTEIYRELYDMSGFDFEISETDCDTLAKDASVSVLVSRHGETTKTLLFKYDPIYYLPLPSITLPDQRTIKISVPKVSSLFFERSSWNGLAITYDIDVNYYPDVQPERE